MKQRFFKTRSAAIKAAWLFCMVAALVVEVKFSGRAHFWAVFVQVVLTSPIFFLVSGIFMLLGFYPGNLAMSTWMITSLEVMSWVLMLAAGWWQWFIAAPWLWRKWKAWRARRGVGNGA